MTDTVTIQVPEGLNAQSLLALVTALDAASGCASAEPVVLQGNDDVFCRGLDLDCAADGDADAASAAVSHFARALMLVRHMPRPVLALVDGAAVGGGVGLAAASDWVIASERATFALPEALLGLVPAMVMPVLGERMTPQSLRALALSGGAVGAGEAFRLGLVDEIARDGSGDSALRAAVRRFSRAEPGSVRRLRGEATSSPVAGAIEAGAETLRQLLASPEVRRRMSALASGDTPWRK